MDWCGIAVRSFGEGTEGKSERVVVGGIKRESKSRERRSDFVRPRCIGETGIGDLPTSHKGRTHLWPKIWRKEIRRRARTEVPLDARERPTAAEKRFRGSGRDRERKIKSQIEVKGDVWA